jgi:mannosyltransferase
MNQTMIPGVTRRESALLVAILAAGAFLRFHELPSQSLWLDEAFSWQMVQFPWDEIVRLTAEDVHPPLYYFLLKGWIALFGDSVFAMRSLSSLLSLLQLVIVFAFCKDLTESPGAETGRGRAASGIALLATTLAALSVFEVEYAREVRMYSLGGLLAVSSSWLLWRALHRATPSFRLWAAYSLSAIALTYTHNYGLLTVAGQGVFVTALAIRRVHRDRGGPPAVRLREAGVALAVVAIAYSAWLPVLLRQRDRVVDDYWIPPLSVGAVSGAVEQVFVGGRYLKPAVAGIAAPSVAAAVLVLFVIGGRLRNAYVALLASAPFLMALAVSAVQGRNIMHHKYLYFSFPFFLIAVVGVIDRIPAKAARWAFALLLLGNLTFQDWIAWRDTDAANKPGIRVAAARVAAGYREGDLVVALDPSGFLAARYYLGHRVPLFYVPDGDSARKHEGKAVIFERDCLTAHDLDGRRRGRAWVIATDFEYAKLVYIPDRWKYLRDWAIADASPYRGMVRLHLYEAG